MRKIISLVLIFALQSAMFASCREASKNQTPKKAKYVFYFIGDGMGFSHIALSEAYLATKDGKVGSTPMRFTQFPAMGMATSYSASNYITCSSAAGTALSTGFKTNNGMLGVAPDSSKLESISYKIHKAGFPVGIMTSVTIDHATPASFYANSVKRSDYYSIASQLPLSGFEFFGGGGFQGAGNELEKEKSLYDIAKENGYEFAYGVEDFKAKKDSSKKMILFQQEDLKNKILPYAVEYKENDLKLPDVVKSAIDFLENEKGFFIMVEGGKIDWAAHANDLTGTIFETLDFDAAIEVAYNFYLKHPDETLIVVTADHETGGVALGYKNGYNFDLSVVTNLVDSKKDETNVDNYMSKKALDTLTKKAMIGWTTLSHTGGAVPVFAIGAGSEKFSGRQDNTDIPKKICESMGVAF